MKQRFTADGEEFTAIVMLDNANNYSVRMDDVERYIQNVRLSGSTLQFTLAGTTYTFDAAVTHDAVFLASANDDFSFAMPEDSCTSSGSAVAGQLTSHMPGRVVALLASPGATVRQGEPLIIIEAMKMEHSISAPADGVVDGYPFSAGERVMPGDLLVRFSPTTPA
jgi:3-methylcrotonyl-CoA carboxylase alpha subunit